MSDPSCSGTDPGNLSHLGVSLLAGLVLASGGVFGLFSLRNNQLGGTGPAGPLTRPVTRSPGRGRGWGASGS